MSQYTPLTHLPATSGYKAGDVLILVGELFGRGYANGIVEAARAVGMTVIGTTVGRRDSDGTLRPLNPEELATAEGLLGSAIINIPLEAGFDLEPGTDGKSAGDILKSVKPDAWAEPLFDWSSMAAARSAAAQRLRTNMAAVAAEAAGRIPADANVLVVHAMAGGVPRARVFMPLLNRIFKSQGDKYLASADFWASDLGKLCQWNFDEVTADTFNYLLDATAELRQRNNVKYVAYGYHGTGILINGTYRWQSYTPYVQGWAKMRLEDHAKAARSQGIAATVFNCPEIQTNSSALFLGVEVSLYPFLEALDREGGGAAAEKIKADCRALLAEGATLEGILERANAYLSDPLLQQFADLSTWPHHSTREEMELMLTASAELMAMNANPKEIVCAVLSHAVFTGVGQLMLECSWSTAEPVLWLNHDILAKRLLM
jgi:hypothetical protein